MRLLSLRRYVSGIYMYISAWISRWQYNTVACAYIHIYTYVCLCIYRDASYIYTHTVCGWEGVKRRKRVWEGKSHWWGGLKWIVSIRMISFSLIRTNFMIKAYLMWIWNACFVVIFVEWWWWWWWSKLKSSSRYLYIYIYIYNDCIVKSYVVYYLWAGNRISLILSTI